MRVLLTGGSGLLGQAMVAAAPGDVDMVAVAHVREVPGVSNAHTADLVDAVGVARLMERTRPDLIVHLAYDKFRRAGIVDATGHLVASGVPLVFASTDNVFRGDGRPMAEHEAPEPVNEYGRWKGEAEALVLTNERSAVVRLPLLISRTGADDNSAGLLRAAEGADPAPGWYEQEVRQPAFVDEIAGALWAIAERSDRAGVWHLAGAERLTRPELAQRLSARLGVRDPGRPVPSPPADQRPRDLWMSDDRARRSLGWSPTPIR